MTQPHSLRAGLRDVTSFGKYQLIAEIGRGGMAEVFLAVARGPVGFSKLVVVKRLLDHMVDTPELVSMFLDEARLAARLNHPNVVQTTEVGEEGGRYFIAMEYLDGQSLDRVLRRANRDGAPLPLPMHLRVVADVLAGLHYAHELADYDGTPLHVVHRDVTPHNVFVTYDGQVKVVDFGIAKAANAASHTRTGELKGKVAYMPPEQARGDKVDRRADVFAAGVLLWEAAAGSRFWEGMNEMQILHRLATKQIPSLRGMPNVAPELAAMCERALAYEPADRYATAADFHADLERYIETSGARSSHRELGQHVATLFQDKRAEIRAVIESQLADLSNGRAPQAVQIDAFARSGSHSAVKASPGSYAQIAALNEAAQVISSTGTGSLPLRPSGASLVSSAIPVAAAERRGTATLIAATAAVALVVAAAAVFLVRRHDAMPASGPVVPEPVAATASASVAPSPAGKPAVTTDLVEVRVHARPDDSRIFFDDAELPTNPFTGKFPKDGAVHKVRVESSGWVTKTQIVTLDGSVTLDVTLDRDEKARPATKHAAAAPDDDGAAAPPKTKPTKKKLDTDDPWAK